ncbi:MAG: hypothetical protein M3248_00430 [Actinomycetota bacterium]|nr:hypothetical protein [Actinomycetota bacterium]
MKRLGVLIASTGVALTLGAVSANAGSYREEVYAPPIRERVVVERPVVRRVVIRRPVERRVIIERPVVRRVVIRRPVEKRVIVERPVVKHVVIRRPIEERVIVERPVERVTVRKFGLPRPAAYEDDGPLFPKWGRGGWRRYGWDGGWDHPW